MLWSCDTDLPTLQVYKNLIKLFPTKSKDKNSILFILQSWTKPLRPFQPILQSYWTLTKQTLSPPPPQFNVVNNAKTTFGNIPWHKLNIELGERGLKKRNMIQHGVYHKNMRIFYMGQNSLNQLCPDCSPRLSCVTESVLNRGRRPSEIGTWSSHQSEHETKFIK